MAGKMIKRTLTEIVVVPEHGERTESAEFRRTKKRLKADGHFKCWVCGATEDIEVHHYGGEWSLSNDIDFAKLKEFCEEWDVYGYGRLLKAQPITTVDDIRNAMCLCREHHTSDGNDGVNNGIHFITFPIWIAQRLAKAGESPVPDDTADLKEELAKAD
ncbi:hypothetical protein [Oryzomonas rubra]|uniref:HNH endonuclease n=1 Tax=Oryzomonas rubra TaxID=2509454 RepID=A0A5A9X7X4_9BACT|nr:hypothetical protein [Oryzomonas rubra]KAA0888753.1 hypothetical protein ET418_15345 [Oryzomonas rubra]